MGLIKNRENILKYHGFQSISHSLNALEFAFKNCSPDNLVKTSITLDNELKICDINNQILSLTNPDPKSILVISVGKASERMLTGLKERLEEKIGKIILIIPKGSKLKQNSGVASDSYVIIQSSHPIPNQNSVYASKLVLDHLKHLQKYELVVFLISGGASSLIVSPASGLTLLDKKAISKQLVSSGADIREINTVRKHLSQIKGGKILRAMNPKRDTLTLILSDVVGDHLDTIGSGLTFVDKSTFREALQILQKYNVDRSKNPRIQKIIDYMHKAINKPFLETVKPDEFKTYNSYNCIIGNNSKFCESIVTYLNSHGYNTHYKGSDCEGSVTAFSHYSIKIINELKPRTALVMGGEITNNLNKSKIGYGGRNQEAICRILQEIHEIKYDDFSILCIGTDGIDGNSKSAGGIISPQSIKYVTEKSLDVNSYLDANNSNVLLRKLRSNIDTGYTGTNFNDIYLFVRGK